MFTNEIEFLLALLAIFAGFAIVLFKILDTKQDELDKDVSNTYDHLRKHILDPILGEIFGGKRGRYKPHEFFNTPEVTIKLSEYRRELFKFNKVSEMKGSIMLMIDLSFKTTIGIVIVILAFIAVNEIFINSIYNSVEISISQALTIESIILAILATFLAIFVKRFFSINASFKAQVRELKGGLP